MNAVQISATQIVDAVNTSNNPNASPEAKMEAQVILRLAGISVVPSTGTGQTEGNGGETASAVGKSKTGKRQSKPNGGKTARAVGESKTGTSQSKTKGKGGKTIGVKPKPDRLSRILEATRRVDESAETATYNHQGSDPKVVRKALNSACSVVRGVSFLMTETGETITIKLGAESRKDIRVVLGVLASNGIKVSAVRSNHHTDRSKPDTKGWTKVGSKSKPKHRVKMSKSRAVLTAPPGAKGRSYWDKTMNHSLVTCYTHIGNANDLKDNGGWICNKIGGVDFYSFVGKLEDGTTTVIALIGADSQSLIDEVVSKLADKGLLMKRNHIVRSDEVESVVSYGSSDSDENGDASDAEEYGGGGGDDQSETRYPSVSFAAALVHDSNEFEKEEEQLRREEAEADDALRAAQLAMKATHVKRREALQQKRLEQERLLKMAMRYKANPQLAVETAEDAPAVETAEDASAVETAEDASVVETAEDASVVETAEDAPEPERALTPHEQFAEVVTSRDTNWADDGVSVVSSRSDAKQSRE
jgi:hypothetical protein